MAVISSKLIPGSGSYVAEAKYIAYTEGTGAVTLQSKVEALVAAVAALTPGTPGTPSETSASTITYDGTQTIKEKIESLESNLGTSSEKISYTYKNNAGEDVIVDVKSVLDNLRASIAQIENLSQLEASARESATTASNAAASAQAAQMTITTAINEKLADMTDLKNAAESASTSVVNKIVSLENIADNLQATLNWDAKFRVISRNAFNNLPEDEKNGQGSGEDGEATVFLIYDDAIAPGVFHNVQVLSNNALQGMVVGGGNFAENSNITIVGLPKSGYEFDHWTDGETEDTTNPKVITVDKSYQFIAYFKAVSNS